ncbi:MAG: sigma 54-interacting transcriptional regulator [Deltaproteobacteria bacterium]|nr:sigma 54-interacting transcriptional regulator [Deltaproteobacteria bacterium]
MPPNDKGGHGASLNLTLSSALEGLPVGVLILDAEGVVAAANRYMTALLGLKDNIAPAEGRHVSDLLPESAARLTELLAAGAGSECMQLPELEGQYLVAIPLDGEDGGLSLTAADLKTLGAYFGALPASRASNRLHDGAIAVYPEGLIVMVPEGVIVYANERAAEILGVRLEDVEGCPASRLGGSLVSGEWLFLEVLAGGRPVAGFASCPSGLKSVFVSGAPVFGPDGSLSLAVFTLRNLEAPYFVEAASSQDRDLFTAFREEVTGPHFKPAVGGSFARKSPAMRRALEIAARLSRSGAESMMVVGEPGSGRSSLARYIHESSSRAAEPFVRVCCSRREASELEREIFGAEAGSTTVAGLLEAAGRGTVCLEDADALPYAMQKRIADFVSTRKYRRTGGRASVGSEAALVVSATGDPNSLAEGGRLAPELHEALVPHSVTVPPLRSRKEDIVEIARGEVGAHNVRYGLRRYVDAAAADILAGHSFPGNVRELKSALHKAAIFSGSPNVGPFLGRLLGAPSEPSPRGIASENEDRVPTLQTVKNSSLNAVLDGIEKRLLDDAIRGCRSTREMAGVLGISQAGVSRKLKKFSLDAPGKYSRK